MTDITMSLLNGDPSIELGRNALALTKGCCAWKLLREMVMVVEQYVLGLQQLSLKLISTHSITI